MRTVQYSSIGKRIKNEDSFGISQRCLVVCDGVGGSKNGELASSYVVKKLLNQLSNPFIKSEKEFQTVFHCLQEDLNNEIRKYPDLEGMATTIAFIYLSNKGIFTGHSGDTRIVLIKKDEAKFWQTTDHAVVATMVRLGEITLEEARTHPLKNQITNAIIANKKGKKARLELNFFSDLKKGDLAFICSDGVLEAYPENELFKLLSSPKNSLNDKLSIIKEKCFKLSEDNNTAILAEFEEDDIVSFYGYPSDWKPLNQEQ